MGQVQTIVDFEVLAQAARRLATLDDPDDLTQDAWLAIREEPTLVRLRKSWLAGVLRNRARMRHRAANRRRARERRATVPTPSPDAEKVLARAEVVELLRQAIEDLSPQERRLIEARYFQEHTTPEIAEAWGLPASTVRSRLSRAVARLRTEMDRRSGGERLTWAAAAAPIESVRGTWGATVATGVGMTKTTVTLGAAAAALVLVAWAAADSSAASIPDVDPPAAAHRASVDRGSVTETSASHEVVPEPTSTRATAESSRARVAPKMPRLSLARPEVDPVDETIEELEDVIEAPDPEHTFPQSDGLDRELLMKQTMEAWVRCAG